MMTVMTGVALVRKVCYSYPLQRQTLTHMFAWSLLSDGFRSVAPNAPPQPPAAGRQAINEPHFQEVESNLKEKCRKAFVKYDEPGQDEDYLLGSGDIEEEEKAKKATYKRRNKLRKRISREWARHQCILDEARKAAFGFCFTGDDLQWPVCAVCDTVGIGSKKLTSMSKEELLSKETRISTGSFEEHYDMKLHPDLVKQYERDGLEGLLLSPRARELDDKSVEVCESCRNSLRRSQESPPR